jgi:hypothetical protein
MEFCHKMDFSDAVSCLQLMDNDVCAFMDLTEREYQRYIDMNHRAKTCATRHGELIKKIGFSPEEEGAINSEMLEGPAPTNLCFTQSDIDKAVRFLRDFPCREDFPVSDLEQDDAQGGNNDQEGVRNREEGSDREDGSRQEAITPQQVFENYDEYPPFELVNHVIDVLPTYKGAVTWITDLDFEKSVFWLFYEAMGEHITAWVNERMRARKEGGGQEGQHHEQAHEDVFTGPVGDGEYLPSLGTWVSIEENVLQLLASKKRSRSASAPSIPSSLPSSAAAVPSTIPPTADAAPSNQATPTTAVAPNPDASLPPPHKKVKKNPLPQQTPQKPVPPPAARKLKHGSSNKDKLKSIRDKKKAMGAPSRLREVTNADGDVSPKPAPRPSGAPPSRAISPDAASAFLKNDVVATTNSQEPSGVGHDQFLPQKQGSMPQPSNTSSPVVETPPAYVSASREGHPSAMPSSEAPQNPSSIGSGQFSHAKHQHSSQSSTPSSQAQPSPEETAARTQHEMKAANRGIPASQLQAMAEQKRIQIEREATKYNMTVPQYMEQVKLITMEAAKHKMSVPQYQEMQKQKWIAKEAAKHKMPVPQYQEMQRQKRIATEAAKFNVSLPQYQEMQKQKWLTLEAAKLNTTLPQFQEMQKRNQELEAARLGMTIPQFQAMQNEIATEAAKRKISILEYLATWKHAEIKAIKDKMTGPQFEQMVKEIKRLASENNMTDTQYLARQKHTEVSAAKNGLNLSQFVALRKQIDTEARMKELTAPQYLAKMQAGIQQVRQQAQQQAQAPASQVAPYRSPYTAPPPTNKKRRMSTEDEGSDDVSLSKKQRIG